MQEPGKEDKLQPTTRQQVTNLYSMRRRVSYSSLSLSLFLAQVNSKRITLSYKNQDLLLTD